MASPDVLKRLEEIEASDSPSNAPESCFLVRTDDMRWLIRLTRALLESQDGACWLIWSNYHRAFWGPGGQGYSDLAGAGRYTLMDALSWAGRRSVDPSDPRSNPPELVVPAPEFIARAEKIRKGEV